jgi:hypothetical protein
VIGVLAQELPRRLPIGRLDQRLEGGWPLRRIAVFQGGLRVLRTHDVAPEPRRARRSTRPALGREDGRRLRERVTASVRLARRSPDGPTMTPVHDLWLLDVLDILLVAVLFYRLLILVKGTRSARCTSGSS